MNSLCTLDVVEVLRVTTNYHTSPMQLSHIDERIMQIYHFARFANVPVTYNKISSDVGQLPTRSHILVVRIWKPFYFLGHVHPTWIPVLVCSN